MIGPLARPARARRLALVGLLLASTGCAGLFSSYNVAPNGLHREDDALRRLLVRGQPEQALERGEAGALPGDELLQALYIGILAHYAGEYARSDSALERAAQLADDRYTRRVSRAALSLISSDRVLPFEPGRTERRLIHYYGALNRLHRGDLEGAAVEARRLAFLLELDRDRTPSATERPTLAFLRYFTGLVFEAAGERNDAGVAYRNAAALLGGEVDSAALPPLPDTLGEVVVLVEEGFVAHRVEQALILSLHPVEVHYLTTGAGEERVTAAASIAARVVAHALADTSDVVYVRSRPRTIRVGPPPDHYFDEVCDDWSSKESQGPDGRESDACAARDGPPYILRIAWPVHRQEYDRAALRSWSVEAGEWTEPVRLRADLSDAVIQDFEGDRAAMLARLIARSTTKIALTRGIERGVSERDEGLGQLLGLLTNLGTALLEQADTRSWQLLPGRIGVVRLRLPPGTHPLTLRSESGAGRRIDLGSVEVRAGRTTFVSTRDWY